MRGERTFATSKIMELAQKVEAVATKRSMVKATLPRLVLKPLGKASSAATALTASPDATAVPQKAGKATPSSRGDVSR